MFEPIDMGGGDGTSGGGSICYCLEQGGTTGEMVEVYSMGMILFCHKCLAGGTDCNGTICGGLTGKLVMDLITGGQVYHN